MINGDDIAAGIAFLKAGLLAAFGGLVGHVVDIVQKKRTFSWPGFLAAAFVAFFVGQVLGDWIPLSTPGRDGILMVSGTSAYPVLVLLQDMVTGFIKRLGTK